MGSIIGVVGTLVSGKGTFSKFIAAEGYRLLSFGDEVRTFIDENLEERGPNDRRQQQIWGNKARQLYGPNIWTGRLINRIGSGDYVVDGFRYPDQIEHFDLVYGDKVRWVGVDARPWKRYQHCLARDREGDPKTWEEFLEADGRDKAGYLDGVGQNVNGCMRLVRTKGIVIQNDGTLEDLKTAAANFLNAAYS